LLLLLFSLHTKVFLNYILHSLVKIITLRSVDVIDEKTEDN